METILILVISLAFIGCDKSTFVGLQHKIKYISTALLDGTHQDIPSVEEIMNYGFPEYMAIIIKGVFDGAQYQHDVNLVLNDPELSSYAKTVLTTDDNGFLLHRNIVSIGSDQYDFPSIPLHIQEQAEIFRGIWLDLVKKPNDPNIVAGWTLDTITLAKTGLKKFGWRLVTAVEKKVALQAKTLHLLPNGDAGIIKTACH